MFGVKTPPTTP